MCGPGRYVPDPTEGMSDVKDLPAPQRGLYGRHHQHTPCPRWGQLASRPNAAQRLWHDRGEVATGRPVALLVTYASPECSYGKKSGHIALSALAPAGRHATNRVMDLAVRVVVAAGVPSRPPRWYLWRAHRVCVPCATLQQGVAAGGKGARASPRRLCGVGA